MHDVNVLKLEISIAGRNIVKEFAHLKWGLFDENVSITDKIENRFYNGNMKTENDGPTRFIQNNNIYLKLCSHFPLL